MITAAASDRPIPSTPRSFATAAASGAKPIPNIRRPTGRTTPAPPPATANCSQRDQRRRVGRLVKNTLVLDLKHSAAEVWLVGPLAGDLVKNNLDWTKPQGGIRVGLPFNSF